MTAPCKPVTSELWSPHQRARLVRLCTALVGDAGAAEDLAQETFVVAWRLQHRLDPSSSPRGRRAWLDAIARNVCRRWLHARASVPRPVDRVPDTAKDDLESTLEQEELVDLVGRALALVPAAARSALVGHYVQELSHAEIAERSGTTVDAVSMRVSRGRRILRGLLETRFADEAVAEGWLRRDDIGWRPTRLACTQCGSPGLQMRHVASEVAFRCPRCDPRSLSVRIPLDAAGFAALMGTVRRPSAVQARIAAWSAAYWRTQSPRCVGCDRTVAVRTYLREDASSWSSQHGWWVDCGCGMQVSGSVAGLTTALPQARAALRIEPRLRALPVRDVVRDGVPAKVVAYGNAEGQPLVSAVFQRDTLRLVHVD